MLEEEIGSLKSRIWANNGTNIADVAFASEVDRLISVFYDDIGEIKLISMRSLFDLFVIKTLYVERGGRDAGVVDYLGEMLTRYLFTRELFPVARGSQQMMLYLSDLLDQTRKPGSVHFQNLFEAYRKFADNSLFIVGVFPQSLRKARRGRRGFGAFLDKSYFVTNGKTYYRLASEHDLAEFTQQRETLVKLSAYFDIYSEALEEMSERYLMGFDMNLIADKMLDSFNLYRRTGEKKYQENARKYAALLKVDQARFPSLFKRRARPIILEGPPGVSDKKRRTASMNARVTTAQGTPENLDESIRKYREELLPTIQAMDGFKGNYLLVNRETGKAINVSLWDSEASEQASAATADTVRAQVMAVGSGAAVVETYEVAIQPGEDEGQRLASAVAQAARELEGQVRKFAASDEVTKVRRQVESSLRSFEEWARHRGGPPPQE